MDKPFLSVKLNPVPTYTIKIILYQSAIILSHWVVNIQHVVVQVPRDISTVHCKVGTHANKVSVKHSATQSPSILLSTYRGPFSLNKPKREEPPGPPCNHSNTGAFSMPLYETSMQHTLPFVHVIQYLSWEKPEEHVATESLVNGEESCMTNEQHTANRHV